MEIEVPRRPKPSPTARKPLNPDPDWSFLFDEDTESVEWKDLCEKKNKPRLRRIYWGIAAIVLVSGIGIYSLSSRPKLPLATELSSKDAEKLESAIQTHLREKGPAAAVAISGSDASSPSFVIGTNLQEGTTLDLTIEGVSETLAGRFQFSSKIPMTIHKGMAKSDVVRQAGGQPLVKGEYLVTVNHGQKTLAEKTFFLGGTRDKFYEQSLLEFHTQLQTKSETELVELKQGVETITRQVLDLNSHFQQYARTGGRRKEWINFLKGWDVMQKQVAAPFSKWNNEAYTTELFYGELYREMKTVLDRTDAIQGMQSRFLDLGFVDRGLADEIANEISALHGDLAGIQAKIQAAEALPMTANGMPQRPDFTAAN